MSYRPFLSIYCVLPLLVIDGIIELALLSSMVAYINGRLSYAFSVNYSEGNFMLKGHPAGLGADHGHTSNGAAGVAVVLIGFGGLLAILLQRRKMKKVSHPPHLFEYSRLIAKQTSDARPHPFFTFWTVCTILSVLLTLAALIYTFVVTNDTDNQTIDIAVAAANASPEKYPLDDWTPETWFAAVIEQVDLTFEGDRAEMRNVLRLARGWRWNLIPLFILGLATSGAAVYEWLKLRRSEVRYSPAGTKERVGESI